MNQTQTCPSCGIEKPLTHEFFDFNKTMSNGYNYQCKTCKKELNKAWYGKQYSSKVLIHTDKVIDYADFLEKYQVLNENTTSMASVFKESDEQVDKNNSIFPSMGTIDSLLSEKYCIKHESFFLDDKKLRYKSKFEIQYIGDFEQTKRFLSKHDYISFDSKGIRQWCNLKVIDFLMNHLNDNGILIFTWINYFINNRSLNLHRYFKKYWNMNKPEDLEAFILELEKKLNVKAMVIHKSESKSSLSTCLICLIKYNSHKNDRVIHVTNQKGVNRFERSRNKNASILRICRKEWMQDTNIPTKKNKIRMGENA